MDAVREELIHRGIIFALARVKQDLLTRLDSFGLTEKIRAERLFPILPTAVQAYRSWARHHPAGEDGDASAGVLVPIAAASRVRADGVGFGVALVAATVSVVP